MAGRATRGHCGAGLADELALELAEAAAAMAWTNEDEDHDGADAWFDDQQRVDLGGPGTP